MTTAELKAIREREDRMDRDYKNLRASSAPTCRRSGQCDAKELIADAARFRCLLSLGRKWGKTLEICVRFPLNKDPRDCLDDIIARQKSLPASKQKPIRLKSPV